MTSWRPIDAWPNTPAVRNASPTPSRTQPTRARVKLASPPRTQTVSARRKTVRSSGTSMPTVAVTSAPAKADTAAEKA